MFVAINWRMEPSAALASVYKAPWAGRGCGGLRLAAPKALGMLAAAVNSALPGLFVKGPPFPREIGCLTHLKTILRGFGSSRAGSKNNPTRGKSALPAEKSVPWGRCDGIPEPPRP